MQEAVEMEIRIAASPETVFGFFTDGDKMIQWIGRKADLDPRPGGRFRCDINGRDIATGEYVELDPPHRIVFTWGWESEIDLAPLPGESTVEVTFEPVDEGTLLRLIHRGLGSADAVHRDGWEHYVERLHVAATGGNPGTDPWAVVA